MTKMEYNPNNTEGHHSTSFDFMDTEIRKNDKIVATDLTDLYDVEINNVQDGEILVYDESKQKWVNGEAGGQCDIITVDTTFDVGFGREFENLNKCFEWLRENCKVISEDAIVTIIMHNNEIILHDPVSLNHPYGHRIMIDGQGYYISKKYYLDYYKQLIYDKFYSVYVSCGYYHTMAIKQDGTLWGTGVNGLGQLGVDSESVNNFIQSGTDNDWVSVTGGGNHSIAIKQDGTLWTTGYNYYGQLGLGDNVNRNVFTQVGTDNDWKQVDGGSDFTIAIKQDGTLWATGYNYYGQLGLGDNTDRNIFTQVGTDNDWDSISCGDWHSIALKTNGTIWSTGHGGYGQLGLNLYVSKTIFTQEIGLDTNWVQVACGDYYSMAIKSDGTLWGTGSNRFGQLGTNDRINKFIFTQEISLDNDWKQVACGFEHSISIKQDGTLWGTGNNHSGQLGLGDNVERIIFVKSGTDNDWISIDCNGNHSMVNKTNKSLWGTGSNGRGQLSLGNNTDVNIFNQSNNDYYQYYIDGSEVDKLSKEVLSLTDGNSIKDIKKMRIISHVYKKNQDSSLTDIPKDHPIKCFEIKNNSNIKFTDCELEPSFNEDITYNHWNSNSLEISNNSHVLFDIENYNEKSYSILLKNNSSIEIKNDNEYDTTKYLSLKNKCTLITDNPDLYSGTDVIRLTNSKIIEKK